MSYESEFDGTGPIKIIAIREFGDKEFKAEVRKNQFMFGGHCKAKDLKKHMGRAKEVFK